MLNFIRWSQIISKIDCPGPLVGSLSHDSASGVAIHACNLMPDMAQTNSLCASAQSPCAACTAYGAVCSKAVMACSLILIPRTAHFPSLAHSRYCTNSQSTFPQTTAIFFQWYSTGVSILLMCVTGKSYYMKYLGLPTIAHIHDDVAEQHCVSCTARPGAPGLQSPAPAASR